MDCASHSGRSRTGAQLEMQLPCKAGRALRVYIARRCGDPERGGNLVPGRAGPGNLARARADRARVT